MKSLFSFPLFFISSEEELAYSKNLGLSLQRLQVESFVTALKLASVKFEGGEEKIGHGCKADLVPASALLLLLLVKHTGACVGPVASGPGLEHMVPLSLPLLVSEVG